MLGELFAELLAGFLALGGLRKFGVNVEGDGMMPAYPDGTRLWFRPVRRGHLRTRQVVVAVAPDERFGWGRPEMLRHRIEAARPGDSLILRIAGVPGDRMPGGEEIPESRYYLRADNAAAPDSRTNGLCPRELIFGVMPGSSITSPALWPPKT